MVTEQEIAGVEGFDNQDLSKFDLGFPVPSEKEGMWPFFNKVLEKKDSSKTGNLDNKELEAVRIFMMAGNFAEVWESGISDYIRDKAQIVLKTSDSKNGFFLQTAVTQKKKLETRTNKSEGKRSWFKRNQEQEQE